MLKRHSRWMLASLLLGGAWVGSMTLPFGSLAEAAPGLGTSPHGAALSAPEYVPGRYLVVFKDSVARPGDETARIAQRFGSANLGVGHVYTGAVKGFAAYIADSALAAGKNDPAVSYIERDQVMHATGIVAPQTKQRILADLTITGLTATPSSATAGQNIDVAVTVKNAGAVSAVAFSVSIYKNLASVPTTVTAKDATKTVASLAPGASTTVSFSISYAAEGTYQLRALTDSTAKVFELNENNNAGGPVTITVNPANPQPDLTITSLTADPTSVAINGTVSVSVTVKNNGNADAGAFDVTIYPDLASVPDPSTPKGSGNTQTVGGLAAGASTTLTFSTSYASAGSKSLRALSDSNASVGESNEGNNAGGPVTITVTDPNAVPDLIITGLVVNPTSVQTNQTTTATVTVKNQGTGAAGSFSVSIYPDLASVPTTSTPKGPTSTVNSLAAGASVNVQLSTSYSTTGSKSLRALADSNANIGENDENNNAGGPVTVTVTASSGTQEKPTGIRRIGADQSSTLAGDGSGEVNAIVAIIDTGIDLDHPDLTVVFNKGFGYASGSDDNGHGTHVAGTVAARDNSLGVVGVAPGAKLWALKALDAGGSGWTSDIVAAVDYCKNNAYHPVNNPNGVMVANMSLGGGFSSSLNTATNNCVAAGVVVCVAAGNSAQNAANTSPASAANALTLAALADSDGKPGKLGPATAHGPDDTFAAFSNYGAVVDFIAPGVSIKSTVWNNTYASYSGTSMASPHAAGLAALIKANNTSYTPADIRTAIMNAVAETIPGKFDSIQYPLINAKAF